MTHILITTIQPYAANRVVSTIHACHVPIRDAFAAHVARVHANIKPFAVRNDQIVATLRAHTTLPDAIVAGQRCLSSPNASNPDLHIIQGVHI